MSDSPVRCGWCEQPAVTEVITRPGRKTRMTAPVCEAHAVDFERRGIETVRSEVERKLEAQRKRSQWKARQRYVTLGAWHLVDTAAIVAWENDE